ncbi:carbohydrate ABC transporter membrane protein 1, CUT1 family [Austwickia chelonae]|uniref:Putative ABC transporter permease protein n=1 Tax=Austwickia chelonae NBRC 105200 TaxID=1184607 RepID=K6WAK4_9MICO|nr:sugar ABC transporter permease [Austwickia chelonae]GAB78872.1 putative ABC transporter permease protein [Austwickia chelonae NBRC 105200]SEV85669.1 carbohydrate ABC transporter membrane protein 1, CUT1 family [Austwickia chelonae]
MSLPTPSPRTRRKKSPAGDARTAAYFLLPASIGFLAFSLAPTLRGIWFSFTDSTTLAPGRFVGLENYRRLSEDPLFWDGLLVTSHYVAVNIASQTAVALLLALILDRFARQPFWRTLFLLPWLIPGVTVTLLWMWLLDPTLGAVNGVTDALGLGRHGYFNHPDSAITTVALVNTWRYTGYQTLLLLAGMQRIDPSLYEAAAVDGSGTARTFWHLTLPLLKPVLTLVLVISTIGSFQIFDTVAVATQGGPSNATNVVFYYIYTKAFTTFDLGYASAIAVVMLVLLAGLTALQFALTSTDEERKTS